MGRNKKKNTSLRIAMLGHKTIPSRQGGVEIVVEELATRMAEQGHKVTVYNRSGHHVSGKEFDEEKKKEYKNVRIKYVPTVNRRGLAAMTSSVFGAIACAFGRYDVVHFHAEGPCAMLWLPKLFGKRCIATIHGLDHQRAKWGRFASAYIMVGEKCAVKFADEIIVLSENVQKYFKDIYGRDTIFIPNGVNRPVIRQADIIKKKFELEKDGYILFLGRLVPEKGIRYLIEAFKQVDTDAFATELKELAKEDDRILFTGFVQGAELDELYSNAYVYSLPSDLEGMPLSLLEAMSYGNCCLVSDIEECTSVVQDKAIVFKKSNVSDLKEKLQYACDHVEAVQAIKEEATDYICKRYDWDNVTDRTLRLYRNQKDERALSKQFVTDKRINSEMPVVHENKG